MLQLTTCFKSFPQPDRAWQQGFTILSTFTLVLLCQPETIRRSGGKIQELTLLLIKKQQQQQKNRIKMFPNHTVVQNTIKRNVRKHVHLHTLLLMICCFTRTWWKMPSVRTEDTAAPVNSTTGNKTQQQKQRQKVKPKHKNVCGCTTLPQHWGKVQ